MGISEYLATQLQKLGVLVTATDNWRDCDWSVDCRIGNKNIYFFVVYYGRPPVEYVLCCTSDVGFFSRLRGINDDSERWELARAVHRVIANDGRFHDIRWYVDRGWAGTGDEPWVAEPPQPRA
jgi:hypothetical protein